MKRLVKLAVGFSALVLLLVLSTFYKDAESTPAMVIGLAVLIMMLLLSKVLYSGFRSFIEVYGRLLPNALTLANMCMGMASILLVLENPTSYLPAVFILLASFFDVFDGKLARKLNAVSSIGKELDSLCDLVTFGVAPMVLLWQTSLSTITSAGAFVVFIYVASGAYRLARYNVSASTSFFMGMPITFAGILSALWFMSPYSQMVVPTVLWVVFLSFAMVSKVRFKRIDDLKAVCKMKDAMAYRRYKKQQKKSSR